MKLLSSKKAISTIVAVIIIAITVIAAIATAVYVFLPKPARDVTGSVTIWHGLLGNELAAWQTRVTAFNDEYPNINVTLVSKLDLYGFPLQVAIPAGTGPDLYTSETQGWLGEFATANLLSPIDDYVDSDTRALYFPDALSAMMYKGKLYGLPLAAESVTLFFNKAFVTTPPEDTDQLIAMLKDPPSGAQYALAQPALQHEYHTFVWVSGFGGYYYNDTTGLVGLNTTGTIAGATWFNTNIKPYLAPDLSAENQWKLFYEGKAAMLISGPWSLADIKEANLSFGLGLVPRIVPQGNALPKPYQNVRGLWMTKNVKSENVEAVAIFLKWWAGVSNQVALGKLLGWVPVTFDAYNDLDIQNDPVISGLRNQIEHTVLTPVDPQMSEVWGPARAAWDAVLTGEKTPTQAFQDAENTAITNIKSKYGHYP